MEFNWQVVAGYRQLAGLSKCVEMLRLHLFNIPPLRVSHLSCETMMSMPNSHDRLHLVYIFQGLFISEPLLTDTLLTDC